MFKNCVSEILASISKLTLYCSSLVGAFGLISPHSKRLGLPNILSNVSKTSNKTYFFDHTSQLHNLVILECNMCNVVSGYKECFGFEIMSVKVNEKCIGASNFHKFHFGFYIMGNLVNTMELLAHTS